jgi:hypothetical protein
VFALPIRGRGYGSGAGVVFRVSHVTSITLRRKFDCEIGQVVKPAVKYQHEHDTNTARNHESVGKRHISTRARVRKISGWWFVEDVEHPGEMLHGPMFKTRTAAERYAEDNIRAVMMRLRGENADNRTAAEIMESARRPITQADIDAAANTDPFSRLGD